MSLIYDYLYISDQIIEINEDKEVLSLIGLNDFEYVEESFGKFTTNSSIIFIGEIKSGTIFLGGGLANSWIENNDKFNSFLNVFYGSQILGAYYNDRVMATGFILADGGKVLRMKDFHEKKTEKGQKLDLEERIYFELEQEYQQLRSKKQELHQMIEPQLTLKTINELEKLFIGYPIQEIGINDSCFRKYIKSYR